MPGLLHLAHRGVPDQDLRLILDSRSITAASGSLPAASDLPDYVSLASVGSACAMAGRTQRSQSRRCSAPARKAEGCGLQMSAVCTFWMTVRKAMSEPTSPDDRCSWASSEVALSSIGAEIVVGPRFAGALGGIHVPAVSLTEGRQAPAWLSSSAEETRPKRRSETRRQLTLTASDKPGVVQVKQ